MYFISENSGSWKKTAAKTLAAAKRAATRAQVFQGTDIWVGEQNDDEIVTVAKKLHRDALDMNATGSWQEA